MKGAAMGTLSVNAGTSERFSTSALTDDAWVETEVHIDDPLVMIKYVRGPGWSGDAAISEVRVACAT